MTEVETHMVKISPEIKKSQNESAKTNTCGCNQSAAEIATLLNNIRLGYLQKFKSHTCSFESAEITGDKCDVISLLQKLPL